ncbi:MAG TPA: hypothetical protein VHK86_04810, partial [Nitrososphaera sp.]|nr:hypothetical protein [Nitrososphaera sp.]
IVFHFVFVVTLWPYTRVNHLWTLFAWREVLVVTNVYLLMINLIPRQIAFGGMSMATDGARFDKAN